MFKAENTVETKEQVRVFGYTQARELTSVELASVGGGLAGTSYSDNGVACAADDCTAAM